MESKAQFKRMSKNNGRNVGQEKMPGIWIKNKCQIKHKISYSEGIWEIADHLTDSRATTMRHKICLICLMI